LRAKSVLIVDDNETNRRILKEMTAGWGMNPTCSRTGEQAIEIINRATTEGTLFHLVLLDACMPGMDGFEVVEHLRSTACESTVMMLTSANQHGDIARCRQLGISAYLIKPVTQSDLLDSILTALGASHPSPGHEDPRPLHLRSSRLLRILLAEDNVVNQRLAAHFLERRNHSVTIASNGRDALAHMAAGHFDVVLMDVQMPHMDGFETTAAIRSREKRNGHRTPIIAMTAHAMQGDRERCLAAGMDDYIAKPLQQEKLFAILDRVTSGAPGHTHQANVTVRTTVLERAGGDAALADELVHILLRETPSLLATVSAAIDCRDHPALARAAHTLKGAVGSLGMTSAERCAMALETLGRKESLGDEPGHLAATSLLNELRKEIRNLEKETTLPGQQ
jgi:CheY-like chemotaxis protein/HPt (histidine-containing phosphotransfer) domain-containing protein